MAAFLDSCNTSPCAVDKVDQWNSIVGGHVFNEAALAPFAAIPEAGATANSEVLTTDCHGPPSNEAETHYIGGRGNALHAAFGLDSSPCKLANFLKRSFV